MHLKGLRFGQEHRLPLIVTLTHFGLASIARHRSQTAQAERYYLRSSRIHSTTTAVLPVQACFSFCGSTQPRESQSRDAALSSSTGVRAVGRPAL